MKIFLSILLSAALLMNGISLPDHTEKETNMSEAAVIEEAETKQEEEKSIPEEVTPENGSEQEIEGEVFEETASMPVFFAAQDESYVNKKGYFYIYVRKEGEALEKGHWYRLDLKVGNLSAQTSQKITWDMTYIGDMPESAKDNVGNWITSSNANSELDNFSMKIEKGETWEATRQDAYGTNPVLSDPATLTEEQKAAGLPYPERYYMMCGKILYEVNGYRMYFDKSVFGDLKGLDIEKENKDIQKKDERLEKDEKPWTGDGYFKFAIDTNNVGMTAAGASGEFHHSMYGFFLKPNTYTVKFNANGGTGTMKSQNATYDKNLTLNQNKYTRTGYKFVEWNRKKTGGTVLTSIQDKAKVKNLTAKHKETVTLYAQWEPNVYTATLNNQDADLKAGTKKVYEKYETGWYKDSKCTKALKEKGEDTNEAITIPQKTGYKFLGYFDKKTDGTKMIASNGKMTSEGKANFKMLENDTWYAQWAPYDLSLKYNANGGKVTGTPTLAIKTFIHKWEYGKAATDPANFSSFGISKEGYSRIDGKEWNLKSDGTGKSFDQDLDYEMVEYAPKLKEGDQEVTLYAQWQPNVYTVTLNNQLTAPDRAGTKAAYKKYNLGWYKEKECKTTLSNISIPVKLAYIFLGYYSEKNGGKQMIDKTGDFTADGKKQIGTPSNETWYAHYDYQVSCEDYADIPCDLKQTNNDIREDIGVQLSYNSSNKKVIAATNQAGCSISLKGKPAGTKIGNFQSYINANALLEKTGSANTIELPMIPQEGAAYQLEVTKGSQTICSQMIYYKNGRFRTLMKLGEKDAKTVKHGGNIAGSEWGIEEPAYSLYKYVDCSKITSAQAPGTVDRYFHYKDVNMAYSGNGATAGTNTLEYDVSLEDFYQFRDNGFTKEEKRKKWTEEKKQYECNVKYSFQGWELKKYDPYQEKQQEQASEVYNTADQLGAISDRTTEDISTYQNAEPILVNGSLTTLNLRGTRQPWEAFPLAAGISQNHASEYINLKAKWNAYPTIVVTPGDKLEFYEGEEVTKEMLISHLTAHDDEDNQNGGNLNSSLRITKISYPESKNKSQKAYKKAYKNDVPAEFLLDTYYLKLEKDESVNVLVTFAVTDSTGNLTKEQIPVKIKYNNYPEIESEDVFYYLKEEANRGEITEEALIGRAAAKDIEDGTITEKLGLKDFDPQIIKMQTEAKAEFTITYQVTDSYRKTTYKTVKLMVLDEDASIAEMPKYYVRFISEKHLDTLEENSVWREPENLAYLKSILQNETPMETWQFTHEDVLAVQAWITENDDGQWKLGQEANQEFLRKFAHCRQ